MRQGTVHILVSDLFPRDAIGNFTAAVADRMRSEHVPYIVYAERHAPGMPVTGGYAEFFHRARPEDTLLYQLSNGDPAFPDLMRAPCKRVVYYHNITPGGFFRPDYASTADMLDAGRAMLPHLSSADAAYANSAWSLAEILPYVHDRAARGVMPPLTKSSRAFSQSEPGEPDAAKPYLLVAGRIMPHKNTLWAVRLFAEARNSLPGFSLVVMGSGFGSYEAEVKDFAASTGPAAQAIRFTGAVSNDRAAELFRKASGLICASLHEGFGVPLVEAMALGLPVFALDQPAVRETLGGAGILLDGGDIQRDADAVHATLADPSAIAALRRSGQARAEAILDAAENNIFWDSIRPGSRHA